MKNLLKCAFIFLVCNCYAQSAVLTTGGTFSNSNTISFSVGQLITAPISNASNSIYFGVQQPKELMALGIDELLVTNTLIYPNPTYGTVHIKLDDVSNFPFQMQLFDLAGRIILSKTLDKPLSALDISSLSNGLYLINITKNSKSIHHIKIIKK